MRSAAAQRLSARVLDELFAGDASIYAKLDARLRACQPERGDLRALAPCAEVDLLLHRLVAIIQGDYAAPAPVPAPVPRPSNAPLPAPERDEDLERLVRVALEQRIAAQPSLRQRAQRVRRSAAVAETAMEQHYSRNLLAELRAARAPFPPQPPGRLRTAQLERCLANFPYTRNYRLLTLSELRLLEHPAPPLLLRATHAARLSLAQRLRFEAELLQLRARANGQAPTREMALSSGQTIAVCGSGPLPLSGLMFHTLSGARVSLIERDLDAVSRSRALIAELERLQLLAPGAVEVVQADVAEYTPCAQVILVASLVDNPAKLRLVERLRGATFGALLLRSASSLCAELAYEAVDTLQLTDPSLPFCGECVPASAFQQRSEQLVCSAREVLNNTELYRPVALEGAAATGQWLRGLLAQLRDEDVS